MKKMSAFGLCVLYLVAIRVLFAAVGGNFANLTEAEWLSWDSFVRALWPPAWRAFAVAFVLLVIWDAYNVFVTHADMPLGYALHLLRRYAFIPTALVCWAIYAHCLGPVDIRWTIYVSIGSLAVSRRPIGNQLSNPFPKWVNDGVDDFFKGFAEGSGKR